MGRIHLKKPLSRKSKFYLLSLIPVYFIAAGLLVRPFNETLKGMLRLIAEPDFLITDYFVIGGIGAAFLNAGLLSIISIWIIYKLNMEMSGHTITSVCLIFGFSLFGKNLLNIWAILFGVFLYAKYHKTSVSRYLYIGFYGTSLSPILTQIMQIWHVPLAIRLVLSLAVGSAIGFVLPPLALYIGFYGTSLSPILTQIMQIWHVPLAIRLVLSLAVGSAIGFVLPPLATHVHYAHKGYSLYNVGFAAGIIATVVVSLMRSFGVTTESRLIWSSGNDLLFFVMLSILFGGMMAGAVLLGGRKTLASYREILKSYGLSGTDYVKENGGPAAVFNMGLNGLFAVVFVLAVGGDLNGPTIGSIFTIVGFSATGKHIRNIFPIMLGVCLGGITKNWNIYDPSAVLALLLSTTLAPIAGEFGWGAGILAGFLHSSVALNVGSVYGGMNLYNNGFAGGLVAIFPIAGEFGWGAGILAGFLHSSVALNVGSVYGGMNLYNNGFAGGLVAIFLVPVIQSVRDRRARARGGISL